MKPCDRNLQKILRLVDTMFQLADEGDAERADIGCGILYGVLRDSAYKLKQLVEKEQLAHQRRN